MAEKRLIDANALDLNYDRNCFNEFDEGYVCGCETIIMTVKNAPTVDAKPVVHAHWVYDKATEFWGNPYRCSNCHAARPRKTKFCPDCGSKMDEEV